MSNKETTREKAKRLRAVQETFVTGLEAAQIKGVSPKAVYEAIASGRLASVKVGGCHMINRKDLDAWRIIGHRPRRPRRMHPWMKLTAEHDLEARLEDQDDPAEE